MKRIFNSILYIFLMILTIYFTNKSGGYYLFSYVLSMLLIILEVYWLKLPLYLTRKQMMFSFLVLGIMLEATIFIREIESMNQVNWLIFNYFTVAYNSVSLCVKIKNGEVNNET